MIHHGIRDSAMDDRNRVQRNPTEEHAVRDGLNDREEENIIFELHTSLDLVLLSPISLIVRREQGS